jgi:hypothetical protein
VQGNELVSVSWVEPDRKEWGYFAPAITVYYDLTTQFLLSIELQYNRRLAKRNLAFNAEELRDRLKQDMDSAKIWAAAPPTEAAAAPPAEQPALKPAVAESKKQK